MKNTTLILGQLRLLMLNLTITGQDNLSSYIVPSSDAHHNIRRADCDQRVAFLSGFDGSSGTAIVTQNEALLWTDARYYIQADQQMDDNWLLMKDGMEETLTQSEWLIKNVRDGTVGIDPTLYSKSEWDKMEEELKFGNLTLVAINNNLVDFVWGSDRPPRPQHQITELGIQFAGKSAQEKLHEIREEIQKADASLLVITELDEVAWLLNLRGTDLPESSTFFTFAILSMQSIDLFIDTGKVGDDIKENLISLTNGTINFYSYDSVVDELTNHVANSTGRVWVSKSCNSRITNIIPVERQLIKITPISLKKAIKNPTEINGMRKALIREGASLCQFYSWLETAMNNGENITEVSAADKLLNFKKLQENFVNLSFKTISGSGSNGAIIHYFPTNETDRKLSKDEMYLIDTGSHYLDGTTDTTRTFHFGTPTDYQSECYTRILKGQIEIATSRFPLKTTGHAIDALARKYLWEIGLDFGHGTGHGVGAYLNVGEGPQSINSQYNPDDPGLKENMITSNEPGYYLENSFGIRLENLIRVAKSSISNSTKEFLQMEDLTFVPYQHKLIKLELLTQIEVNYLNDYQIKCREITGAFILDNNMGNDTYEWLIQNTQPLSK